MHLRHVTLGASRERTRERKCGKLPNLSWFGAECKRILAQIGITITFNSYQEAIKSLEDPNTNDEDELNQPRIVIKQNLVVYALWVLYSADKSINTLNQQKQITDEVIDAWPQTIMYKYNMLIKEDIKLLLYHKRELALNKTKGRGDNKVKCFSERDKIIERHKFSNINLSKLTKEQQILYTTIWKDLVEVSNSALTVRPFHDPG